MLTSRWEWLPSVDVELVALWVFHRYRVVIDAFLAQVADHRGTEIRQPCCLGVDSLPAGCDRNLPPAADVNVEVEPVLDCLDLRHHLEPDTRSAAIRIDDAVRADSHFGLRKSKVAPPVVPGGEARWGWLKLISQSSSPEAGKQIRIGAVDY